MDAGTIDYATLGTALLAIITSLGGAVVIAGRGKAVKAVADIADTLMDVAQLMNTFSAAMADDQISKEEVEGLKAKSLEIQDQIKQIRADLGM